MDSRRLFSVLLLAATAFFSSQQARALSFEVAAIDATHFKYVYHVDGSFTDTQGFTLLYNPSLYSALSIVTPLDEQIWNQVITGPFLGNANLLITTSALVNIPVASGTFAVTFKWAGGAAPGAQPFEIFDALGGTSSGSTIAFVSGVPEPSTYVLMFAGLLVVAATATFRRRPLLPRLILRA